MARILIVDDSPSQLMGIRRIVEKLGHEAVTAEDGVAYKPRKFEADARLAPERRPGEERERGHPSVTGHSTP